MVGKEIQEILIWIIAAAALVLLSVRIFRKAKGGRQGKDSSCNGCSGRNGGCNCCG